MYAGSNTPDICDAKGATTKLIIHEPNLTNV